MKIQKLIARLEAQYAASDLADMQFHRDISTLQALATVNSNVDALLAYNEIFFRWKDGVRRGWQRKEEVVDWKRIVL